VRALTATGSITWDGATLGTPAGTLLWDSTTAREYAWTSANDGASSGLDADLLDGLHASAFALAAHLHAISDVTGLQGALDAKQGADSDLTALGDLSTTGPAARTATATWVLREIKGAAGRVSVANGSGVGGDPTIDLADSGVIAGSYGATGASVPNITTDAKGRVTAAANRTLAPADIGAAPAAHTHSASQVTDLTSIIFQSYPLASGTAWTINHTMPSPSPAVTVVDSSGNDLELEVVYDQAVAKRVHIFAGHTMSGTAYLS